MSGNEQPVRGVWLELARGVGACAGVLSIGVIKLLLLPFRVVVSLVGGVGLLSVIVGAVLWLVTGKGGVVAIQGAKEMGACMVLLLVGEAGAAWLIRKIPDWAATDAAGEQS
ncbi:MAG: hypothetical protein JSR26_05230 [Proteobacteria bacterium]|nr:hypothetical protein [Pseudomonadota bacterium]